jgi:Tetratricopeptide repeat
VNATVVASSRRLFGAESPETLGAINNLAFSLAGQGKRAEAARLIREVLAIQRRVLPADHPRTALTIYNLACLAAQQGERDAALAGLRDALAHGLPGRIAHGLAADPDLASLRGDPGFEQLVTEGRARR